MSGNKKRKAKSPINPVAVIAGIVVLAATAVLLIPRLSRGESVNAADNAAPPAGGDLVIRAEEIGSDASYFDYDADGITVQVFAVRAPDGTVRLALNTCQVCNGSPYAYFEQDGADFICQNCGNRFPSSVIGQESGGCNPVPVTEETYTEQDGVITIPAAFLEENAARFTQWKKF